MVLIIRHAVLSNSLNIFNCSSAEIETFVVCFCRVWRLTHWWGNRLSELHLEQCADWKSLTFFFFLFCLSIDLSDVQEIQLTLIQLRILETLWRSALRMSCLTYSKNSCILVWTRIQWNGKAERQSGKLLIWHLSLIKWHHRKGIFYSNRISSSETELDTHQSYE